MCTHTSFLMNLRLMVPVNTLKINQVSKKLNTKTPQAIANVPFISQKLLIQPFVSKDIRSANEACQSDIENVKNLK